MSTNYDLPKQIQFESNFNKLPLKTRIEINQAITKREVQLQSIIFGNEKRIEMKKN
jgi:hypothetical protein